MYIAYNSEGRCVSKSTSEFAPDWLEEYGYTMAKVDEQADDEDFSRDSKQD